jgi:AraC-like DNA-binding protein
MRAGFFDQSHMTRVVKRFLGVTPAVLRRQYTKS